MGDQKLQLWVRSPRISRSAVQAHTKVKILAFVVVYHITTYIEFWGHTL